MQASADAKYYGNDEVYGLLKARGAQTPVGYIANIRENQKILRLFEEKKSIFVAKFCISLNFVVYSQKTRKTPMTVYNPQEVPEYELNPAELHFRRGDELQKACSLHFIEICFRYYCSQVVLKYMPLFLKEEEVCILERLSPKHLAHKSKILWWVPCVCKMLNPTR